jgi:phospholipase C
MRRKTLRWGWVVVLSGLLMVAMGCGSSSSGGSSPSVSPTPSATPTPSTRSAIQHVIVVIGENHSFDNVFGTYVPSSSSQTVWNLLSQGIVNQSAQQGTNFARAAQNQATDTSVYQLSPPQTGAYSTLPQPNTTLSALPNGPCILTKLLYNSDAFCSDSGLDPASQGLLSNPGTGQPLYYPSLSVTPVPDCRYPSNLPNGPYSLVGASQLNNCGNPFLAAQITTTSYVNNVGDPVHRFYQMWQQMDCNVANASTANPSGCVHDLYTWVATTMGWGLKPPTTLEDTYQGGIAMGYYNMAQGDYPFFLWLAQNYSISDNYHQPVLGGTGPNSQFLFTGDMFYNTGSNGSPATPAAGLIENPNPMAGTNNFYLNDTLGPDPGNTGTGFTNCSDKTQPGVAPIMNYLGSLSYKPFNSGNCAAGAYYEVNNDYPYYTTTGAVISSSDTNEFPAGPAYSIGPQTIPTIGDDLSAHSVTWKYYGEGFQKAASAAPLNGLYCAICNAFQYSTSIMTSSLRNNLTDLDSFYSDLAAGNLPAVSFVKPDVLTDSHPGTSTPPLFEAFVRKLIATVQANPQLWSTTAILITFDESGGQYDSGYIQPIDFFGDGPRTVLIAVSPYTTPGSVDHTYSDHASILKFIEWNWRLPPLSSRSRDNLPNPTTAGGAPYFPTNSPAIGDLTGMFNFSQPQSQAALVSSSP